MREKLDLSSLACTMICIDVSTLINNAAMATKELNKGTPPPNLLYAR